MQKELQLYTASLYSDLFSENHLQKKKVDLPKEKKEKRNFNAFLFINRRAKHI